MRAVIQRVKSASVEVEGKIVSSIGPGLLCLVGLKTTDTAKDAAYITKKILKTRAFNGEGEDGRSWDKDVISCGYEVLLVSQFTLYGRLQKAKPDFTKAMSTAPAKEMWAAFVAQVQEAHKPELVKDGVFGAMMDVALVNDGPVTFLLDSETD
ncbi:D-Tyr tRNAtyr deacylase-like domain-containing protein [Haematococcus lacustris]